MKYKLNNWLSKTSNATPFLVSLTKILSALFTALCLTACTAEQTSSTKQITWRLDALQFDPNLNITVEGDPRVINVNNDISLNKTNKANTGSVLAKVIEFDGVGDRLVVKNNPLLGAEEFSIEAIIKPNDAYPLNTQPRFFHIESAENPNRRITLELRLNDQAQWYLDTYIKSDNSKLTLVDENLVHPVNEWVHVAMTYKNQVFSAFVNGKQELSGTVTYEPIAASALTSIGARLNKKYWFNGNMALVRISDKALTPNEFLTLSAITSP
ncbi:LamG domain-containing protein [Algibacillus agarilyticus]|uniref:LamG domain-containing protein n=1 Tax=Algibacillus agarilyticus TaxID=2234133 RepID=UPI000DD085F1|nr:LamG domain-containing protein [Algibacillus agarilyticus]